MGEQMSKEHQHSQKILILGGYGYLGSYISEAFLREGFKVWILGRNKQNHLDHYAHHFISCDISNEKMIAKKLSNLFFDLAINASGQARHRSDDYAQKGRAVHFEGSSHLLKHGSFNSYYHISSFHVYGSYDGIINEESPTTPQNRYGEILLKTEQLVSSICQEKGILFSIFRLSNGYGCPHSKEMTQWQLLHNAICKKANEGKEFILKSNPKSTRDFIYLGDASKILLQIYLEKKDIQCIQNLCRGKSHSMEFLINSCERAFQNLAVKSDLKFSSKEAHGSSQRLEIKNGIFLGSLDFTFRDVFEEETKKIIQLIRGTES